MNMKLYELANPSDPYTFYAPSIEVAGIAVALLSTKFGAIPVGGEGERSPVLLGWDNWMKEKGIDSSWIKEHRQEIATTLESFLIGNAKERTDIESILSLLPDDKKQELRDLRQDRHRSSLNPIGEAAYKLADQLRNIEA